MDCSFWSEEWPSETTTYIETAADGRSYRVYGFSEANWEKCRDVVFRRCEIKHSVLPSVEVVHAGKGAVVVAEAVFSKMGRGYTYLPADFEGDWQSSLGIITDQIAPLTVAISALNDSGLVWLTFDPNAIAVDTNSVTVTNLDTILYPIGECPSQLRISPLYSAPEVCNFAHHKIGNQTDVFQLASLVYYQIAGLPQGFAGAGLDSFGHRLPNIRIFQPKLPPGISPVLVKALSHDPSQRYSSVRAFYDALCESVSRSSERKEGVLAPALTEGSLQSQHGDGLNDEVDAVQVGNSLDIGAKCVTGPAKEALSLDNQDAIAFGYFEATETNSPSLEKWAYGLVADGVSTAKFGSGDIASEIAKGFYLSSFEASGSRWCSSIDFDSIAKEVSLAASEKILKKALEYLQSATEAKESDFMGSTATIAVCNHENLYISNVGDSRIYLVSESYIEQLTIDGDVASYLVASGTPPEEVAELGAYGKALKTCLGAAKMAKDGGFVLDSFRATPQIGHWRVRENDVVVLCSDGLIEESVFLEPHEAKQIIDDNRELPAQAIAELLVATASEKQRLPSSAEPNGFGDNISCVVIKIK